MSGETTAPADVPRAEIQARIFDAGAMVEQPFAGGRGSILLGGRYGYTGFLLSKVAPDYSLGYWDYQARLAYRVTPTDTISLFAFGAYDRLTNELRRANLLDVQFHRLDLRWDHRDEDTRARLALTASADHEANGEDRVDGAVSDATRRGLRLRGEIAHRFAAFRLRAGADVGLERFTDDRVTLGGRSFAYDPRNDLVSGAWVDLVARPARGVEIVPGLRVDLFRTRGDLELVADPRLAVRFRLGRGVSLVSAVGVAHQVPTASIPVPGRAVGGLEGAPLQEAYQASEALELALPSYVFVKLTAFAARIHVPRYGTAAENHGLEVFVRRDFTKTLGFLLSYTLARTSRPGSLTGLSEFDRTHVLSAVLGYDLGAGFRLGVRGFFETGRPYVQRCPYPSCSPGPVPAIDAPYPYVATGRMPSFFRFDARFEKRWTFGERWIAATLEWFNATLSTEPDYVAWDPMLGSKVIRRSALTLPSLGVEAGY
jgi:hypothetical protein